MRHEIRFLKLVAVKLTWCLLGNRVLLLYQLNVREASCEAFLNIMPVPLQIYHRQFEELIDNEKYKLSAARAT